MNDEIYTTRDTANSAVMIHTGALGDFVMSLRIVSALRANGAQHVAVLGRPGIASIAMHGGGVDEVIDIETGGFHALFSADVPLSGRVIEALGHRDLAVNTLFDRGDLVATRLREAGIRRVIDVQTVPRADWTGHISEQWLADLRKAGLSKPPTGIRIAPTDEHRTMARRWLDAQLGADRGPTTTVLAPGSGSLRKCWGIGRFTKLAKRLQGIRRKVVILLGPVERDLFGDADVESLRAVGPILQDPSLSMAAALIAEARLFVGNDSGITHLAAAVGTPTVAVFGPTNAITWRPMGPRVAVATAGRSGTWPEVDSVVDAARYLADESRCWNCGDDVTTLYSDSGTGGMTQHVDG